MDQYALHTPANDLAEGEEGGKKTTKEHFDQKEGRKDQLPPTAASVLIKMSVCMQLDSAWS